VTYNLDKSAAKHDREIEAIRRLLIQGGKYLAETAELQKENEKVLRRLLRLPAGRRGLRPVIP
jgi:hypothetical protein